MITVPELIWSGGVGALAGAIVALVTTWLNNRGQNRRQAQQLQHDIEQRTRQLQHDGEQRKVQLDHDVEQRRIDREMGLRREVYLEAAVATGKMQEFIASYARQDISESDKLAIIQGSTATLNKIHIVGTNQTIEVFSAAQLAFAKCISRLGTIKIDIVRKTIDIGQQERHMRLLEDRRRGLLQMAQELGPSPDLESIEKLRSSVLRLDEELEEISDSLDKDQDELFSLQMALSGESTESNLDMLRAFSEAVVALRGELHLDFDSQRYRTFIETHQSQVGNEMKTFLTRVSEKAKGEPEQPHNPSPTADR